jgi:hypothetical protein
MRRARVYLPWLVVALLAATPASSEARVKQRFDDIYTMAVNAGRTAENTEVAGLNAMIGSASSMSQTKCQASEQATRDAISQAASASAASALSFFNSRAEVSRHLLKILEEKPDWYTRPTKDMKVVRRALREYRDGFVESRVAYSYLATAFDAVRSQDCATATVASQVAEAQSSQTSGQHKMTRGLSALRSLL